MSFHLGKPILVMLVIAIIGAFAVALRPAQRQADLNLWVFAEGHHRAYAPLIAKFEQEQHVTVNSNLLLLRAINVRLGGMMMADLHNPDLPDLVEIEIGAIGKYFRPPVEDVGFLPLNDYCHKTGWDKSIVKARLAPWTKDGQIFGVPHDVHPVAICYRDDLFLEAGIDLSTADTWPEYQDKCVQFKQYWRSKGMPYRHAIEFPEADAGYIIVMLMQRHINLVDHHNNIYLADPRVAQTVSFYAQMVAGPRAVAGQSSGAGRGSAAQDLSQGNLCSFITPDWRLFYLKQDGPDLAGKMRLMPLPVFDPTDAPTSTWGGTMIGITKGCRNPDLAWKLIEKLYFSPEGLKARLEKTSVLPPIKSVWSDPVFNQPDPYLGGQHAFELYMRLAEQLPERIVTPASIVAQAEVTVVLGKAIAYLRERNSAEGLDEKCQQWLEERAEGFKERIRHWSFDDEEAHIVKTSDTVEGSTTATSSGSQS